MRNAALRKSWALDPAIRNYVNPALEYAYDWNTPGGVPGSGELGAGVDVARMVSQIMGEPGGRNRQIRTQIPKDAAADSDREPPERDLSRKNRSQICRVQSVDRAGTTGGGNEKPSNAESGSE